MPPPSPAPCRTRVRECSLCRSLKRRRFSGSRLAGRSNNPERIMVVSSDLGVLSLNKNFLVIPALALGIVTLAHAQAPAAAAAPAAVPTRVAILNVQQAVLNTADGKKATADLTA